MRIFSLLLAALLLLGPTNAFAEQVGHILRLQGQAAANGRSLAAGSALSLGERLTTGPNARLLAELNDGTELTLGANAEFTIDELVIAPEKASALFHLTKGAFRMIGGAVARAPDHRMEVTAPIGTIGIRGTDVWGGSLELPLDVFLLEGEVSVTSKAGTVILNRPGQGTSVVGADSAPSLPHFWKPDLKNRAYATVSFDQ